MEVFWLTASMVILFLRYAWDSDRILSLKKKKLKNFVFLFVCLGVRWRGVRHIKNYGPWKEPINHWIPIYDNIYLILLSDIKRCQWTLLISPIVLGHTWLICIYFTVTNEFRYKTETWISWTTEIHLT